MLWYLGGGVLILSAAKSPRKERVFLTYLNRVPGENFDLVSQIKPTSVE